MQSLLMSATIVVPLFIFMGMGLLLHKTRILSDKAFGEINVLCFKILLPVALFRNIYNARISSFNNPRLIIFAFAVQVLIILLLVLVIPILEKNNASRASLIQGIFRINLIAFGFAIVDSVGSGEARDVVSLLAAMLIPFYNLGSIFIMEHYCGVKGSPAKTAANILKNPFILAFAIAILFVAIDFKIPVVINKVVEDISNMATPISLIALGGCVNFASAKMYRKQIVISVVGKLLVIPGLLVPISIAVGFRGPELLALMIVLISPTAIASFNMARIMGANAELAGHIVVFQSLCSVVTIFFWFLAVGLLGYGVY